MGSVADFAFDRLETLEKTVRAAEAYRIVSWLVDNHVIYPDTDGNLFIYTADGKKPIELKEITKQ